jgi:predicted metal-dependent peptidase
MMTKVTTIENNPHPAFKAGRECKMSDFTDLELEDINDRIRSAVMSMLIKNEFFGIIALKLKRKITDTVPTAAVDGRTMFFNPAFVKNITQQELVFLVAHEVYHCVFQHFIRRDKRNPVLWNMAGDYVINFLLKRDGIGKLIEGGCYDAKYAGMTTEQIYEKLFQEAGGSGQQKGKGQKGQGSNGEPDTSGMGDTIDVHIEPTDENGDPVSEAEAQKIGDELRSVVIQAAKAAGNVPGEIKRMVDSLLKPKIKWRDLIEATIASKQKYDTSFRNPHRRSWSNVDDIIFPGDVTENMEINISIALDNSGSIGNDTLRKMLSEVKGIAETFNYKMNVWCFDTRISGHEIYETDDGKDVADYVFTGGGGTDISSNFKYMKNKDIDSDMLIVFTDMYCCSLNSIDPNQVDTVWVVYDNPSYKNGDQEAPFGRWAMYDD